MSDLLPCPFCGGEAMHIGHDLTRQPIEPLIDKPQVACVACAAMADADQWNTRPAQSSPSVENNDGLR